MNADRQPVTHERGPRRLRWWFLLAAATLASAPTGAAEPELTGDRVPTRDGELIIHPINHATLALGWNHKVVYVDPVGGAKRFAQLPRPDVILITHIHFDHLDPLTLKDVITEKTALVAPAAVLAQLPADLRGKAIALANGQTKSVAGITVEGVAAYNLTANRLSYHPKGRDNGYILTLGDKRVYLSGDTEDTPEMRALKNIDVAFLCMNLPYTMDVEQAARVVREFRPKIVYPYHYRGSDLEKFKQLVGTDVGTEVRLHDWYK